MLLRLLPVVLLTTLLGGAHTAQAATLVFKAEADATVSEATPSTALGRSLTLEADASPVERALVRFTVAGCTAAPTKATMWIRTTDSSSAATADGPKVYGASSSWTESTVTWNTKPSIGTTLLADAGSLQPSASYPFVVTTGVRDNGTFTFALVGAGTDGTIFHSREEGRIPELHVECSTTPIDDVAPTVSISGSPSAGATTTSGTASFTVTASETATIECRLDAAPFGACPSPASFSSLPVGTHKFEARATDPSGNVGTASRSWTVTFPTASSTGVPSGTTLRVVGANTLVPGTSLTTDAAGDLTITTPGVLIDRIDLSGQIKVRAADVTIRNSLIRGPKNGGTYDTGIIDATHSGVQRLLIENSSLIAQTSSVYLDGVKGHDFTARGNRIAYTVDGFGVFNNTGDKVYANVVIDRNYASDLVRYDQDHVHVDGTHNDIIQVQGGRNIRIMNNNLRGFLAPGKGDYDSTQPHVGNTIIVQCNVSEVADIIIENNLVTGGGAGMYLRRDRLCQDEVNETVTYTVRNNHLGRDQKDFGNGSRYPIRIQSKAYVKVTGLFTNVWYDTLTPLAEGRDLGIRYDS